MVSTGRKIHSRAATGPLGALATFALLGIVACEDAVVEEEPIVRPVRYARVVAQGDTEPRTYSGSARAELETNLSFRVAGTLIERPVDVGSVVERGDLVAALDATDFQVRLDEARAGLARAEAEQRNADASYSRTRDLYENQNASRTQLDSARALAESASAQYRAAAQQVEAARLQMSYARLSAPEACTVAQTFVEVNQNVSSGQAVVQLNCGGCAEVVVAVPDADIAKISVGDEVDVAITALGPDPIAGIVQEVGVATGARSSTYPVTVGLQETCNDVRSGMAVDVTFNFPTAGETGALVVPYVSVGEDRNGNYVFVIEPDDEGRMFARRRGVTVGDAASAGVVIENGLTEGELIATAGVRRLTPGQQVRLLGETETR